MHQEEIYAHTPLVPTVKARDGSHDYLARCVPKHSDPGEHTLSAIRKEFNILFRFACPHLLRPARVLETNSDTIFLYEDCSRGPLSVCAKSRMNESEARDFLAQIVRVICVLSIEGIAVTYLTPEMIFIHEEHDSTVVYRLGSLLCGPEATDPAASIYVAPELRSIASCVYSLGVLLAQLVFGSPVPPKTPIDPTQEALLHLIRRCTDENPIKRIPLEDLMFHPFMAEPKRLFAEFSLGKLLGEGEFANVYLAEDKRTMAQCEIKELKIQQAKLSLKFFDENTMLRYLIILAREVALMYNIAYTALDKSGLLFLKTHFLGDNVLHLVTEHCAGGNLSALIQRFPKGLPETILRSLGRKLAECLKHLHAIKIVHCRLIPYHILLTDPDPALAELRIASFTLSTKLNSGTGSMEPINSIGTYIPPEATAVESNFAFSFSYDIWSYGIILFEMAFGVQPNHVVQNEKERQALKINLMQKGEVRFPERAGLDKRFVELIRACVNPDRSARPSAEELTLHPVFGEEVA